MYILEIPASRVFLGADAQLLGTSLAGARMPLSICLKSLQGVPYVLGRTFESLGPIMLTFWIFLIKYGKKHTFQWLIWCYLLSCSCTFIKNTGENVKYYFATLLYNLVSKTKIVFQTHKKNQNDQKWDLNWIIGHSIQFW